MPRYFSKMDINVKEIETLGWSKRWAGPFSIISGSYWAKHIINCGDKLGKGFKHSLLIHKNLTIDAYDIKSERDLLGKLLVRKAIKDNKLISFWAENLKLKADAVKDLIKEPINLFLQLSKHEEFEKCLEDYLPFHVAVKTIPDYLSLDLVEKYLPILEDARVYSESM